VNNDFTLDYEHQLLRANKTTLQVVRLKAICVDMYKVFKEVAPSYINEMFSVEFCNYSLRAKNTFFLPMFRTKSHGYRSFMYMGVKLWNALSNDIRNSDDVFEFKAKINMWFCGKDVSMFA